MLYQPADELTPMLCPPARMAGRSLCPFLTWMPAVTVRDTWLEPHWFNARATASTYLKLPPPLPTYSSQSEWLYRDFRAVHTLSGSMRARSSSVPARPYMARFSVVSRLICPSGRCSSAPCLGCWLRLGRAGIRVHDPPAAHQMLLRHVGRSQR